jgi:nicotinamide mononucleotide adenylyltransferase
MENYIVKANSKTNGKDKYALFIGRWQPFHEGHNWLVQQQLGNGQKVCIAIRDIEIDEKNWWTAEQIREGLTIRFEKEIKDNVVKVIVIPDIDSINIGRDVGYDIIEHTPPEEIGSVSGTKIREQLKQQNKDEGSKISNSI